MSLYKLSLVMSLITASVAFAGGGSDAGNGGDAIVLPDGNVVLADPYVKGSGACDTCGNLHEDLIREIRGAGKLMVYFGASRQGDSISFIENDVLSSLTEYRFVAALPEGCAKREYNEEYSLSDGQVVQAVACTRGWITYIRDDLFRRMRLREQAKLIMHERLHHHVVDAPHEHIADLTSAIEVLLRTYEREQSGERVRVTSNEQAILQLLPVRLMQLSLGQGDVTKNKWAKDYVIWPFGGGLVHPKAQVDASTYINLTSRVDAEAKIGAGVTLFGSKTIDNVEIAAPGTILRDSTLNGPMEIRAVSKITGSELGRNVRILQPAEIIDSNFYGRRYDEDPLNWTVVLDAPVSAFKTNISGSTHLSGSSVIELSDSWLSGISPKENSVFFIRGSVRILNSSLACNFRGTDNYRSNKCEIKQGAQLTNVNAAIQNTIGRGAQVNNFNFPRNYNYRGGGLNVGDRSRVSDVTIDDLDVGRASTVNSVNITGGLHAGDRVRISKLVIATTQPNINVTLYRCAVNMKSDAIIRHVSLDGPWSVSLGKGALFADVMFTRPAPVPGVVYNVGYGLNLGDDAIVAHIADTKFQGRITSAWTYEREVTIRGDQVLSFAADSFIDGDNEPLCTKGRDPYIEVKNRPLVRNLNGLKKLCRTSQR